MPHAPTSFVLIPTDVRAYTSRTLSVAVSEALTFQMHEVLAQPRPNHWSRVWPTSVAMSGWLLDQAIGSLPQAALELGCGMGLVSMTLAHLGLRIEGTDREPVALAFAIKNAARNALTGFSASLLDWGGDTGTPTQLLVASDIVYEESAPERLFTLMQTSGLLAPGGRLLLGVPHARTELLDALVARLQDHGYTHLLETRVVPWEGRDEAIDLHVLVRPT